MFAENYFSRFNSTLAVRLINSSRSWSLSICNYPLKRVRQTVRERQIYERTKHFVLVTVAHYKLKTVAKISPR